MPTPTRLTLAAFALLAALACVPDDPQPRSSATQAPPPGVSTNNTYATNGTTSTNGGTTSTNSGTTSTNNGTTSTNADTAPTPTASAQVQVLNLLSVGPNQGALDVRSDTGDFAVGLEFGALSPVQPLGVPQRVYAGDVALDIDTETDSDQLIVLARGPDGPAAFALPRHPRLGPDAPDGPSATMRWAMAAPPSLFSDLDYTYTQPRPPALEFGAAFTTAEVPSSVASARWHNADGTGEHIVFGPLAEGVQDTVVFTTRPDGLPLVLRIDADDRVTPFFPFHSTVRVTPVNLSDRAVAVRVEDVVTAPFDRIEPHSAPGEEQVFADVAADVTQIHILDAATDAVIDEVRLNTPLPPGRYGVVYDPDHALPARIIPNNEDGLRIIHDAPELGDVAVRLTPDDNPNAPRLLHDALSPGDTPLTQRITNGHHNLEFDTDQDGAPDLTFRIYFSTGPGYLYNVILRTGPSGLVQLGVNFARGGFSWQRAKEHTARVTVAHLVEDAPPLDAALDSLVEDSFEGLAFGNLGTFDASFAGDVVLNVEAPERPDADASLATRLDPGHAYLAVYADTPNGPDLTVVETASPEAPNARGFLTHNLYGSGRATLWIGSREVATAAAPGDRVMIDAAGGDGTLRVDEDGDGAYDLTFDLGPLDPVQSVHLIATSRWPVAMVQSYQLTAHPPNERVVWVRHAHADTQHSTDLAWTLDGEPVTMPTRPTSGPVHFAASGYTPLAANARALSGDNGRGDTADIDFDVAPGDTYTLLTYRDADGALTARLMEDSTDGLDPEATRARIIYATPEGPAAAVWTVDGQTPQDTLVEGLAPGEQVIVDIPGSFDGVLVSPDDAELGDWLGRYSNAPGQLIDLVLMPAYDDGGLRVVLAYPHGLSLMYGQPWEP